MGIGPILSDLSRRTSLDGSSTKNVDNAASLSHSSSEMSEAQFEPVSSQHSHVKRGFNSDFWSM